MTNTRTPTVVSIDIQELREAGEDGGDLMGYFCKGHVPAFEFAEAANHYSGAVTAYDRRFVRVEDVRQVWWRCVPMAGQSGCYQYLDAQPKTPGAFSATVADVLAMRSLRRASRAIADWNRSHANGFADGVNWAYQLLQFSHPEAAERIIERFRDGGSDKTQKDGYA